VSDRAEALHDRLRDADAVVRLARAVDRIATRSWRIMEVCGGQTHAIVRYGLDRLLPSEPERAVTLVHGPGCPVCVTPIELIDRAQAIALEPGVILCSFGDMLRVPGSRADLFQLRAQGADVRVVYSPLDALALAERSPDRRVVFFAVGFETTAPANAVAVALAHKRGVTNFSVIVAHVLTPPAIAAILQDPSNEVQAFLGPGHVCTVTGFGEYEALASAYRVPIAVTGFEPLDLMEGILLVVRALEEGRHGVENQYRRAAQRQGNARAQAAVDEVFEVCDRAWRGVGLVPKSGLRLRHELRAHDAERIFDVGHVEALEPAACISGQVLKGAKRPTDCPAFGTDCTPDHPLGATMVSSEGACAAYYAYGRHLQLPGLPT
jgi:hydrogenase expression/formation protein HypD